MDRKSRNFLASLLPYLFIVQILLLFLLPIEQANSNPLAGDDTALTVVDKSVMIPVLANDTDVGAIDPATVSVVSAPSQGTTTVDPGTGAITYSPAGGFSGTDSFTYTVADTGGLVSNEATVSITVLPSAPGEGNTTLTLLWDPNSEPDLAEYYVYSGTAPGVYGPPISVGTATLYTTTTLQEGVPHYFAVTAVDFAGNESGPSNEISTTIPDLTSPTVSLTAPAPGSTVSGFVTITADADDNVGVVAVQFQLDDSPLGPEDNTAPYSFTWDATAVTTGNHSLNAIARDANGNATTSASLTVKVVPPGSDPPVAGGDSYSGGEGQVLTVAAPGVLGNDSNPNNEPLTAVLNTVPANGTLTLQPNGSFFYTPNPGFSGTDSFTYQADDGQTLSNVATVTLSINGRPVAGDDTATTTEGTAVGIAVLANDTDDGALNPATVTVGMLPANGTTTVESSTGVITYTPTAGFTGTDSFAYTVADTAGLVSNDATVTVTVTTGNIPPVAGNDGYSGNEGTTLTVAAPGVLSNDSDPENDPLTAVLNTMPANGTLTLQPEGSFTYTPNPGFSGADSFTYQADDGQELSNVATVTLSINGRPVAGDDTAITPIATPVDISVLANDTDDGVLDPTTVTVGAPPANGTTAVDGGTGVITYTPTASFTGTDSFTYTVADTMGLVSNAATVTITVLPSPQGGLILNVSVTNGKAYEVDTFTAGQVVYIDRTYTYTSQYPGELEGQEYIRTANNDKKWTGASFLTFELTAAARVYVLYDSRASQVPGWLGDGTWTVQNGVVGTTDVDHVIYYKDFPAGSVGLGGNADVPMAGARSMYSVVVVPSGPG